jgi:hypothetical protein
MVLQKLFRIAAILVVSTLLITACNVQLPLTSAFTDSSGFQSDQQLEANLQTHKVEFTELLKLVQNCDPHTTLLKDNTSSRSSGTVFAICPVDGSKLSPLHLKEVAQGTTPTGASTSKPPAMLFTAEQIVDSRANVFVVEKGYVFSSTPIQDDLVEQGGLDQFSGKQIVNEINLREVWKYKNIGDGWYLYFRQFYQDALP